MNLVDMLTTSMTTESSVKALSEKAGASESQTSSFLQMALPVLINYMTQNASSQSGAQSLATALTQHTDTSSMTQQFGNADVQDGNAIIQHILGNDSSQVTNVLAQQTNMEQSQAQSLLGNMAPGLLSGLSAAASSAQNSQQAGSYDFSGLLSSFGGGAQQETAASGNSGLLSLTQEQPSSGSSSGMGLLGSLMGMDSSSGSLFNSGNDGTSLIGSLLSLLK